MCARASHVYMHVYSAYIHGTQEHGRVYTHLFSCKHDGLGTVDHERLGTEQYNKNQVE
jgi:hypothetical protein